MLENSQENWKISFGNVLFSKNIDFKNVLLSEYTDFTVKIFVHPIVIFYLAIICNVNFQNFCVSGLKKTFLGLQQTPTAFIITLEAFKWKLEFSVKLVQNIICTFFNKRRRQSSPIKFLKGAFSAMIVILSKLVIK